MKEYNIEGIIIFEVGDNEIILFVDLENFDFIDLVDLIDFLGLGMGGVLLIDYGLKFKFGI